MLMQFVCVDRIILETVSSDFQPCFRNRCSHHVWYEPEPPPHDKTSKVACAPSEDSDQPRHSPSLIRVFACAQSVAKDPSFFHADSEDSAQTRRMPRLIWVFARRTLILMILSRGGSFVTPEQGVWMSKSACCIQTRALNISQANGRLMILTVSKSGFKCIIFKMSCVWNPSSISLTIRGFESLTPNGYQLDNIMTYCSLFDFTFLRHQSKFSCKTEMPQLFETDKLSVNEKLPLLKFRHFENYKRNLDSYFTFRVSGQLQTRLKQ